MDRVVVQREVPVATPVTVEREGRTASSAIWALTFIVIVGMIVGALYYSGMLRKLSNAATQPQKVNVEITAPAAPAPAAPANR
ncbi:MAG: hypothetical protein QM785_18795 [Pyrinomonadaceae bacterium]